MTAYPMVDRTGRPAWAEPGQVWLRTVPPAPIVPGRELVTVQAGDTLASIHARHKLAQATTRAGRHAAAEPAAWRPLPARPFRALTWPPGRPAPLAWVWSAGWFLAVANLR